MNWNVITKGFTKGTRPEGFPLRCGECARDVPALTDAESAPRLSGLVCEDPVGKCPHLLDEVMASMTHYHKRGYFTTVENLFSHSSGSPRSP